MAIAIDARTTGANTAGASTASWSHVMGSVSNGILITQSSSANGSNFNVSSIAWDPTGVNQAFSNTVNGTAARKNDTAAQGWAELWYLLNPTAGTKTIKVTWTGSTGSVTGSESYSGVDQTTTFNASSPQTASGSAPTEPSLTVTSASGEQVIDCVTDNENATDTLTVGGSQTQFSNQGNASCAGGGSDEAGAATVTMTWSGVTTSAPWSQVGISIKPASAATATGWGQFVVQARNNPMLRF